MITLTAVILAVGAIVYTMVVRAGDVSATEPAAPLKPAEERRAALEEGLRDLEFEYRLGKLSDRDYQEARRDAERELTQLGERPEGQSPRAEAPVPALVCPHCGAGFPSPLKFCGECGRPMRRNAG